MFVLQLLEGRLFFLQPDVIVFCQFPFVLDVQAKADLMKYESKLNMQVHRVDNAACLCTRVGKCI